jgi:F0F1-type ATP synthase assembly protein I
MRVLFLTRLELKITNLKTRKETNRELMQYAGMGAQFLVSIAAGIFIGSKLDEWLNFSFPLLVWLMPLLIIIGLIIKIVKDTSKK